ncbi:hypothetical protein [Ornithinimicrobium kibberense]|uniref:hypothetical protein n=1 Tax=Ornithinimicrobium kibberense TaxID=282060 RepID=UPI0036164C30
MGRPLDRGRLCAVSPQSQTPAGHGWTHQRCPLLPVRGLQLGVSRSRAISQRRSVAGSRPAVFATILRSRSAAMATEARATSRARACSRLVAASATSSSARC